MSEEQATGLALAFQLLDMALRMQAQRYRREHPDATDDEVEASCRHGCSIGPARHMATAREAAW